MTAERTFRGTVAYLHDDQGETGREWFSVSVHGDGSRTLRATCEMDDDELVRDVVMSLDPDFRPTYAYVNLVQRGAFKGQGWFRFGAADVECQADTAAEGRISQHFPVSEPLKYFGTHPIVCDGLMAAVYDHRRPEPRQTVRAAASSMAPNGATGPRLHWFDMSVEFAGEERIAVAAGTFDTRRYHIYLGNHYDAPLEVWTHGPDHLIVRESWALSDARYELVAFEKG